MADEKPDSKEEPFRAYANNTYFDSTAWDLTVIFGQLGLRSRGVENPGMDWHTAVTLPWPQAKVLAYFLLVNIAIHEETNGPVTIRQDLVPAAPKFNEGDPAKELERNLQNLHEEFFPRGTDAPREG